MRLSELLAGARIIRQSADSSPKITGLAIDSRKVKPGYLFAAINGFKIDGHRFIPEASRAGAAAVLTERWVDDLTIPQVQTPSVRQAIALAAASFYDNPSEKLTLIGVTGTNGKTTTTYFIESILRAAGKKTGLLGGIEYRLGEETMPATRTTPEAIDLESMLARMVDLKVDTATMEVSSHGIDLYRVAYLNFAVAVLTNLTREHLDLHQDMEVYYQTKRRLFNAGIDERGKGLPVRAPYAVINTDDEYGRRLAMELSDETGRRILTYGLGIDSDVHAKNIERSGWKTSFDLVTPSEEVRVVMNIPGDFNLYNALAAAAAACTLGISIELISKGIAAFTGAPGRFELVDTNMPYRVIVDYAHNEDGLAKAISAARSLTSGRVIVVFGCPGERDREKRPGMGKISGTLADLAILTTDDCYDEPPEQILDETEPGLRESGGDYLRIADRRSAIRSALETAGKGDIVLIAGKGHETRQIMASGPLPFNDKDIVLGILNRRPQ
ncbi:MAG: UDP-N-acetylmuramoyl-L-alanyl-D-glutamate--2,6-diaminopimelate ligase [Thermoleophilia bacterium]|jgi:UDP-N-acetylmuramoyl-L-alanyl-D-glutamate--2,6-diaminopimelate ligase